MVFWRRWLLILTVVVLGGGLSFAAGSARENRDFAAAAGAFQDGMWSRAETNFARFVVNYPDSTHAAEAVLLRAQAELKQGKCADAIGLLADTNHLARAGTLAHEYLYWQGEAQFQGANYSDAAQTWMALGQRFPESPLRLRAVIASASAFTKLADWRQTVALLGATNGVFQRAVQMDLGSEQIARGELLLAQAECELKDFAGASAILEPLLAARTLKPELDRQGALLLYRVKTDAGELDAALAVTTNLFRIAQGENNNGWRAEGRALRARALEKLGRAAEAAAAYQ